MIFFAKPLTGSASHKVALFVYAETGCLNNLACKNAYWSKAKKTTIIFKRDNLQRFRRLIEAFVIK